MLHETDYLAAMDQYIKDGHRNAPWPIGVTMVGIHERSAREKIYTNSVAHIMNDETTRKYLQSVKRLMTFASVATRPILPSQSSSTAWRMERLQSLLSEEREARKPLRMIGFEVLYLWWVCSIPCARKGRRTAPREEEGRRTSRTIAKQDQSVLSDSPHLSSSSRLDLSFALSHLRDFSIVLYTTVDKLCNIIPYPQECEREGKGEGATAESYRSPDP
uniref:Pre-mRNA-splicing factor 18 n=1 Tax=Ananas comosus var. bracteatus TaxID=296719 RepID=A0A6V7QC92_ANACO|nr:unnamed protein product [Ananas comosus var. bracteatus]